MDFSFGESDKCVLKGGVFRGLYILFFSRGGRIRGFKILKY